MRSETIAIHSGYDVEPTTKSVAVPIYQTVAYEFDSADHGAALFNLETPGYRYSRIANPTNDVLERRVAALENGVEALSVSSGQAALNYAVAHGIKISNNSWGGGGASTALSTSISNARAAGHLFVVAAGNDTSNNDAIANYPSNYGYDNIVARRPAR